MIAPAPRGAIRRTAARVPWNIPSRWTAITRRHSSSVSRTSASSGVVTGPQPASACWRSTQRRDAGDVIHREPPALLTMIASGPSSRSTVSSAASTAALSLTSAWIAAALGSSSDHLLRPAHADVEHGDGRTLLRQAPADRRADARPAAGDRRHFSFEAHNVY